jgi:agmatine deiminase
MGINWKFNAGAESIRTVRKMNLGCGKSVGILYFPKIDASIVLEGGSIIRTGRVHADDKGMSAHPNRNPNLGQAEIESVLTKLLGARKIIWLNHGFSVTKRDGHIDNVDALRLPGVILMQVCDDPSTRITHHAGKSGDL